jgi:protein-arginine kinase activator protein McsA
MSPATLLVLYVAAALGAIIVIGIFSELRRRRFRPAHSADRIFRCPKCNLVYTDDADVERSRCAQCGKLNEAIEF